jgi:hypothetical protein
MVISSERQPGPITDWQRAFDMVEDRGVLKVLLYPVD